MGKSLEETLNQQLEQDEQAEQETNEELHKELKEVQAPVPEVEEAKSHGHLSKEQYVEKYGTEEGYKEPEEFNAYGKAYSEVKDLISGMKKSLSERDRQIESLVSYNERVEQRAKEKALQELEYKLSQAKDNMDIDAVERLTETKFKTQVISQQEQIAKIELERQQALSSFSERNRHWLNINQDMTNRAKQIDEEERQKANAVGVIVPFDKLAQIVETRLRIEYPEVMISGNTGNSAPTISSSQSSTNKSSLSAGDFSDHEFNKLSGEHVAVFKATNNMLVRQGRKPYSKKEFITKLKKDGEV